MMYAEAEHPNCMLMWMDHMMSRRGQRAGDRLVR